MQLHFSGNVLCFQACQSKVVLVVCILGGHLHRLQVLWCHHVFVFLSLCYVGGRRAEHAPCSLLDLSNISQEPLHVKSCISHQH